MKKVIVIGAGSRGMMYAKMMSKLPEDFQIVAVADPKENCRAYAKERFHLPDEMCHCSWEEFMAAPKFADLVVVATMDRDHFAPAMAAIEKGYDLLLEKPMGATPEECCEIERAAIKKGVLVLVCHVLRFTAAFRGLKNLLDEGVIGEPIHIQHIECVGHIHASHSFVRGRWGNSVRATPMIVQKTCHDMDIMQWLLGKNCTAVHSFGGRSHFRKENMPEGAPEFCLDGCPHAKDCPYNAEAIYMGDYKFKSFARTAVGSPTQPTDEEIMHTLRTTNYGRCVYQCDNDVVDHQTVNLEFEGGATASFSMCSFNSGGRSMRIMGTKGEISTNLEDGTYTLFRFSTNRPETISMADACLDESIDGGHGGGDWGIILALRDYLKGNRQNVAICSIQETCRNHLIAYAAEESRLTGKVVSMKNYEESLGGLL